MRIANIEEPPRRSVIKIDERGRREPSLLPIPVCRLERNMHHSERTCRSEIPKGCNNMFNAIAMLLDRLVARLGADDRGEVSIEYVLVGGLMAVAIVAGIVGLTGGLSGWFSGIGTEISSHLP